MFTDGSFQWGFSLPELYAFEVGTENIIHACGKFGGNVAFGDTTLTSTTASSDVYHARISYGPELPSAIEDLSLWEVSIFPNPFIDRFDLKSSEEIQSLLVYDAAGRIVSNISNSVHLSMQNLEPGNYFIHVITAKGTQTIRAIKL
jgi:hypothetical protein